MVVPRLGRTPTRDRLKLIARVANKEEWYKAAPLSSAEYRLLCNYNDKPLLTRPQQRCEATATSALLPKEGPSTRMRSRRGPSVCLMTTTKRAG